MVSRLTLWKICDFTTHLPRGILCQSNKSFVVLFIEAGCVNLELSSKIIHKKLKLFDKILLALRRWRLNRVASIFLL